MFELYSILRKPIHISKPVYQVDIPSLEGDLGILKDHIPVLGNLKLGKLNVFYNDSTKESFAVDQGMFQFSGNDNHLSIIASNCVKIDYNSNSQSLDEEQIENLIKTQDEKFGLKSAHENVETTLSLKEISII